MDQASEHSLEREKQWLSFLKGKTLLGLRPHRNQGPVPCVHIQFTDGSTYTVSPVQGVYFEGCLINTLRKARPVTDVMIFQVSGETCIQVESESFTLFELYAQNKWCDSSIFPLEIIETRASYV